MTRLVTYLLHRAAGVERILVVVLCLLASGASAQIQVFIGNTVNVACSGESNGSATVAVVGGTTPYTYRWNTGATTATLSNVTGGNYTVTVTDANQQTGVATANVLNPTRLSVLASGESQICEIAPDGKALGVPSGGTPPYIYRWNTTATTPQIIGIRGGNYTITVTDNRGCTASATTKVEFWNEGLWLMDTVAGVKCFGLSDGFMEVGPMSGTAPYTYTWSNGANTKRASNLAPGTYTVTVIDKNGCSHSVTKSVIQPPRLTMNFSATDANCFNSGAARVIPGGGTAPYRFFWSTASTAESVNNIAPGPYAVTITDAKGCTTDGSVAIKGTNTRLNLSTTVAPAGCVVGGSATVSAAGGSGNYTYRWANGQTTATANNLTVGDHRVTVTDQANNCTASVAATIPQGSAISASVAITVNATCALGGRATVTATGGTGNYTYRWSNGETTAIATNLRGGNHSVTVTDPGNCVATAALIMPQPQGPAVVMEVITRAGCGGGGSAKAIATGGAGNYTYFWENNQTTATATNLATGSRRVTITDAAGCSTVGIVNIEDGGAGSGLNASAAITAQPTCQTDGTATANINGGNAPFSYRWSNSQTTASVSGLTPGTYTVTVSDATGCTAISTVTVVAPSLPALAATVNTNATCSTGGTATVTATNGTAPYVYQWSNGNSNPNASNLTAGSYTITVTDAGGCTATQTLNISQPSTLFAVITGSANAKCNNVPGAAIVGPSGGTQPYTYRWSNGETTATARTLQPGQYTVTVTDNVGCTATATVRINLSDSGIRVGDLVWTDTNQNGLQDPDEKDGVAGIKVELIRPGTDNRFETNDDVVQASTLTNSAGQYFFDCVTPGIYAIRLGGLSLDYEFALKDQGTNDCVDSDIKANGWSDPFTIIAGQGDQLCVDAGVHTYCDNTLLPGTVGNDQTICEGQAPSLFTEITAPAGGSGGLEYQWLRLIQQAGGQPRWEPVNGARGQTYQAGALNETTYFMRSVRRKGCAAFIQSNIVTVTVLKAGTTGCGGFLLSFGLNRMQNNTVKIDWTAAPEATLYLYTVERSADQADWREVGGLTGKQDWRQPSSYTLTDDKPLEGMNYYRIRRSEVRGFSGYSFIKAIEIRAATNAIDNVTATPNPVSDMLRIKNTIPVDVDMTVQLLSPEGRWLHTINIPRGTLRTVELPVSELPRGLYFIQIQTADGTRKVLKVSKM
jgi:SdrD B-like domain/SprB repeat